MRRKRLRLWLAIGLAVQLVYSAGGSPRIALGASPRSTTSSGTGDWTMYQGDVMRSGANLNETSITPTTAPYLAPTWKFTTGGQVVASPIVASGVLYVGSWDGYEYAVSIATHRMLWRQFLGTTTQAQVQNCYGRPVGITSTASVQNGVLYVGGGDGNLYALNTSDGSVVWKTFLGAPPYYNWSSPLLYNNLVYIGMAAFCDPPGMQGQVLAFHQSDGTLAASIALVPNGQIGATVWSSPAVDPSSGRIYVTTGNNAHASLTQQPNAEAVLALDPNTLSVLDRWQLPIADQPKAGDADFGATPTLFDVNGVGYIGVLNKNGIYYVLNRANLAAGVVWKQILGGTPLTQDSRVSPSCFANGVLYVGSGAINGTTYKGSIQAFDAATGALIWAADTQGAMTAAVTCVPGLVVDDEGSLVEVRDATTGTILYSYATVKPLWGPSIISNGVLYTSSRDRSVYAFTVQNTSIPQLIFQDNFDGYTTGSLPVGPGTGQWTSTNVAGTGFRVRVTSLVAFSLPNALQFTLTGAAGGQASVTKSYRAGSGYATHAARLSLYLGSNLRISGQNIGLFSSLNQGNPTNGAILVQLTPTRALQVTTYNSLGQATTQTLSTILALGRWNTLEVDQTNAASNGSWSIWVNGTQVAGQTGGDTGNVPITAVIAGDSLPGTGATLSGSIYEDNIVTAATSHLG